MKRLKTATSRRKIPLHPELVRIGFLHYAEGLHSDEASRLFPTLKAEAAGYFSSYPSKRFRETFLPQAMKIKDRQSFYSFRHCFRDALRAIEVPPDTLQALGAWSQGRLVSDNYGTRSKDWRRIHTRYDRCAHTFFSAICIAATIIFWP